MGAVQEILGAERGNSESEYEDAFWVPKRAVAAGDSLRLAVADGATETSYAGLWAKLLVQSYGKHGQPADSLDPRLGKIRAVWKRCLGQRALPWYAEEKVRIGAFSTLLGLSLTRTGTEHPPVGTWIAHAIGDSCLFHIQTDADPIAFPLKTSGEFTSRPAPLVLRGVLQALPQLQREWSLEAR